MKEKRQHSGFIKPRFNTENMKRIIYFLLFLAVIGALVYFLTVRVTTAPVGEFQNPYPDLIKIISPQPNTIIKSPLVIRGEARGFWYFEASFPVKLLDANGHELAVKPVQARGEWMTENLVPFEAELNFTAPAGECGTLVFERDNPSGLPENAAEVRIPVCF